MGVSTFVDINGLGVNKNESYVAWLINFPGWKGQGLVQYKFSKQPWSHNWLKNVSDPRLLWKEKCLKAMLPARWLVTRFVAGMTHMHNIAMWMLNFSTRKQ